MDARLVFAGGGFDLLLSDADLARDDSLETAVIVSLFTDRRAEPGDVATGLDPRGWWGDSFQDGDDRIGSRLWLLGREKLLPETAERARGYAREALQWLLDDGVAARVQVTAELQRPDRLALQVAIERPDGRREAYRFDHVWEALNGLRNP
ncbi:phage GP46 family protein [Kistimonas scapharcae]|uniref:Phage GP46 family protein n=1 Tax=Kistimonas scapharcae TaxID=1036133 RepID=A0ABP8V5Y5_9GAMM